MINNMLKDIEQVYIAYGATDFRQQTHSLCHMIKEKFELDPFSKAAFIFCNRKRNSIRVLCYDKNGFVLAQKTLFDAQNMKFQWPKNSEEMCMITKEQLQWLLSGLTIYPNKYFRDIHITKENIAI